MELKLSGLGLTSLPPSYSESLEVLEAYENRIEELPAALFFTCSALRELHLDHNLLTTIPASIKLLLNLEAMSLHDNRIVRVPEELGLLTRLTTLRLDRNAIAALPDSICRCHALQLLHIDGNPITSLPADIGPMTALLDLGIGSCPFLTGLPASIGKLACVGVWVYSPSSIKGIPESILYDPSAGVISGYIRDNPQLF